MSWACHQVHRRRCCPWSIYPSIHRLCLRVLRSLTSGGGACYAAWGVPKGEVPGIRTPRVYRLNSWVRTIPQLLLPINGPQIKSHASRSLRAVVAVLCVAYLVPPIYTVNHIYR